MSLPKNHEPRGLLSQAGASNILVHVEERTWGDREVALHPCLEIRRTWSSGRTLARAKPGMNPSQPCSGRQT